MPPKTPTEWNQRYVEGPLPWDSGLPSKELKRVLQDWNIAPCRAVDLGCGTGTNAIYLAQQGFEVTGLDCAPLALDQASAKAEAAQVDVEFLEVDLSNISREVQPFDFLFDRGCYHCLRQIDLDGFLNTLRKLTHPGSVYHILTGNPADTESKVPKVTAAEICTELEPLFQVRSLNEFFFEDEGEIQGPLGWSCHLVRRV